MPIQTIKDMSPARRAQFEDFEVKFEKFMTEMRKAPRSTATQQAREALIRQLKQPIER